VSPEKKRVAAPFESVALQSQYPGGLEGAFFSCSPTRCHQLLNRPRLALQANVRIEKSGIEHGTDPQRLEIRFAITKIPVLHKISP